MEEGRICTVGSLDVCSPSKMHIVRIADPFTKMFAVPFFPTCAISFSDEPSTKYGDELREQVRAHGGYYNSEVHSCY